jgi:tRNA(His) 5'-end guanylyltransferase
MKKRAMQLIEDNKFTLRSIGDHVLAAMKKYKPMQVDGMDASLHYLAPHVSKQTWQAMGNLVVEREKTSSGNVDGSRWISLRLDGSGFSKAVRMMRQSGLLECEHGYSERFASVMQACMRGLMEKFNAKIGFTQSDEMVVFIAPTRVVRGEQQPHTRKGRTTKLTTLAAGFVSSMFVSQLTQLCLAGQDSAAEEEEDDDNEGDKNAMMQKLSEILTKLACITPHFDCRMGHYANWEEARSLLLWRGYDCSVNGVSDAVYQIKGSGKQVQSLGKREKVEWLWKQGHLPLPRHQAYGTVMVRARRVATGHNPKLNVEVRTLRSVVETLPSMALLEMARRGELLPVDDVLDEAASKT